MVGLISENRWPGPIFLILKSIKLRVTARWEIRFGVRDRDPSRHVEFFAADLLSREPWNKEG